MRYEQHPRPLDDYTGDDDAGTDGVTVQWFENMDAYRAHMAEPDFPEHLDRHRAASSTPTNCTSWSPNIPAWSWATSGLIPLA